MSCYDDDDWATPAEEFWQGRSSPFHGVFGFNDGPPHAGHANLIPELAGLDIGTGGHGPVRLHPLYSYLRGAFDAGADAGAGDAGEDAEPGDPAVPGDAVAGDGEIFTYEARLGGPDGTPIYGFDQTNLLKASLKSGGLGVGRNAPLRADILKGCFVHDNQVWLQMGDGEPVVYDKVRWEAFKKKLIPVVDARAANVETKGINYVLKVGDPNGPIVKGFANASDIRGTIDSGGIGASDEVMDYRVSDMTEDGVLFHKDIFPVWFGPAQSDEKDPSNFDTDLCNKVMGEIDAALKARKEGVKCFDEIPSVLVVDGPWVDLVAKKGDPIRRRHDQNGVYARLCRVTTCPTFAVRKLIFGGCCGSHARVLSPGAKQYEEDMNAILAAGWSDSTVHQLVVGQVFPDGDAKTQLAGGANVFHWMDVSEYDVLQRTAEGKFSLLPSTELKPATQNAIPHDVDLSKEMSDLLWGTTNFLLGRDHVQKHGRKKAIVLGKDDVRYVGVFTPAQKGLFRLWSPYWNHTHPSVVRAKTGPGGLVPCLLLKVTFTNNSIADIKMEIVEVSGEPQGDPIDASKVRLKIEDGRIFLIKVED